MNPDMESIRRFFCGVCGNKQIADDTVKYFTIVINNQSLDGREKEILSRYYGLGREPQTQSAIASSMGLSRTAVSRLKLSAHQKSLSALMDARDSNLKHNQRLTNTSE